MFLCARLAQPSFALPSAHSNKKAALGGSVEGESTMKLCSLSPNTRGKAYR